MKNDPGILARLVSFGVLATVIAAPNQYSLRVGKETYLSIVDPIVWSACALWLFHVIRSRNLAGIKPPPIVTVLFVLWTGLSAMRSVNILKSLKDIFQVVEYLVAAFLLFANTTDKHHSVKLIVYTHLATATAIILLGLGQYLCPSVAVFDVRATFGNRNVFGGYLSIVVPLMFGLLLYSPLCWRTAWLALAILAGIAANLSGGTFVAISVSLAVLSILKSQKSFLIVAAVIVAVVIGLFPVLPRDNGSVLHDSIQLYGEEEYAAKRYVEWQAAAVMCAENPFLGVGIGNYQDNIGSYYGTLPSPPGAMEPDTQNLYMVLASSTGLPGLACFLGMLFFFGGTAAGTYFRTEDWFVKGLALGLLGSLVAFAINSIWSPLLVRGIGVPFALTLALIIVVRHNGPAAILRR